MNHVFLHGNICAKFRKLMMQLDIRESVIQTLAMGRSEVIKYKILNE